MSSQVLLLLFRTINIGSIRHFIETLEAIRRFYAQLFINQSECIFVQDVRLILLY